MDKETLSNYGWIVICVLVLAVMIALATPFGTFVADAVKSTTQGLFDVNQSALNSTGLINIGDQQFGEGGNGGNGGAGGDQGQTPTEPDEPQTVEGIAIFKDGTQLSWEDLKLEENGTKYGYTASLITDTEIGANAFNDCDNLTAITIPDSVTIIGDKGIFACNNLTSIAFGKNSQLTTIGNYALMSCSSLTNINIPDSVTTIGKRGLSTCISLTAITFGENSKLSSVGAEVFHSCNKLTKVHFPASLTTIGTSPFMQCESLVEVTVAYDNPVYHSDGNSIIQTATKTLIAGCKGTVIPTDGSVTAIGSQAFYWGYGLTSISIPDCITTIGGNAFQHCKDLTTVTFGENSQLTSLGGAAFRDCTSLESIIIPDGITTINSHTFDNCSKMTTAVIGENVTTIDYKAFYATALTSATFKNPNGWKTKSGTVLSVDDMSNPATAATHLISSNLIRS